VARLLGLDVGERRIGVAISAPEGTLAVPLRIIECRGVAIDLATIAEIARSERVEGLVVGFPRSMDGSVGAQARRVEAFAKRAGEACCLPVELWDERLTSVQAARVAPGSKRSKRGTHKDDIAAAIILQSYLERRANIAGEPST
jgi:putative Holliday junction resolvase